MNFVGYARIVCERKDVVTNPLGQIRTMEKRSSLNVGSARPPRPPINTGWKAPVEAITQITQHLGGVVQKASYKQGFG